MQQKKIPIDSKFKLALIDTFLWIKRLIWLEFSPKSIDLSANLTNWMKNNRWTEVDLLNG